MFGLGVVNGFLLIFLLLPFLINARLAVNRGKNVVMALILTCIFSWIVTLILFFLPEVKQPPKKAPDIKLKKRRF